MNCVVLQVSTDHMFIHPLVVGKGSPLSVLCKREAKNEPQIQTKMTKKELVTGLA